MNLNHISQQPKLGSDEPRPQRLIFRAAALQHHERRREKTVLPRFVAPRWFVFFWIVSGLFVVGGIAAWLTPMPVYASGTAIAIANPLTDPMLRDPVVLVAFLPAEDLARLQIGQDVFLQLASTGERIDTSILAIEPTIISPELARQRFGLNKGTAQLINQPAAVVIARLTTSQADLPLTAYLGSFYRADVQIGSRRVISFVPVLGQLFGE